MLKRLSAILFAVVLAFCFTTITRAQDTTQKAPMKEAAPEVAKPEVAKPEAAKPAVTKSDKEMGKMEMAKGPLMSATCDPSCGFMVRSRDEKELSSAMIKHAKKWHNKTLTDKDVKAMMKKEEEGGAK